MAAKDIQQVNNPSASTQDLLGTSNNQFIGSGNVSQTVEGAKNVSSHFQTHVYKPIIHISSNAKVPASKNRQKISCCSENIDNDGRKLCNDFKAELQELYSTLTLPKVAWIKGGHDLSIVEHFFKLRLIESNKPSKLKLEDVFKPVNNKPPIRILVEGQPGFGKTTLATKLAHDWATNKEYINFKFAFFIPLRELRQRSIQQVIVQIANHCGFTDDDEIIQIVKKHEQETIFILDGLDEMLPEHRLEIIQLLDKKIYRKATSVVFSRTGLCDLRKQDSPHLFGIPRQSGFYDKRILTLGVKSEKTKKKFLLKFIPKEVLDKIVKNSKMHLELFDSPLFLMLVPVIIENDKTIGQFVTRTVFYKKLFNSVLKHTCVKRGLDIHPDYDLFSFKNADRNIQKAMTEFGMLAAQKLVKKELKFESDKLTNEIYEFGFLMNHKEVTYFTNPTNHYEALHLSILEFFAAFALSTAIKSREFQSAKNLLEIFTDDFIQTRGTSLIMPFLATLMEDDLDNLLRQINTFSPWFSFDFDLTLKLLAECSPLSIAKSTHVQHFIPSHLKFKYASRGYYSKIITTNYLPTVLTYDLSLTKELIKRGSECGKIQTIEFDEKLPLELVTNEIHTCLKLELHEGFTVYSNIPCKLQQIVSFPIPFNGSLSECLRFAASACIASCSVDWSTSSESEEFLQLMQDRKFNKIKFRYLHVKVDTEFNKQLVMNVLKNNQVEHLKLGGNYTLDTSALCRALTHSTYLTRLSLSEFNVDLNKLTNDRAKKYGYLNTRNCLFKGIQSCNMFGNVLPIEAITAMAPSHLDCTYLNIDDFIEKYPTWVGFNTVESISVCVGISQTQPLCLSSQMSDLNFVFRNLRTLHLFNYLVDGKVTANFIHNLPIEKLLVENVCSNLFKCMNDLWADKGNSRLRTISFVCSRDSHSDVVELMNGLECDHWNRVNLFTYNSLYCGMAQHVSGFNITYSMVSDKIYWGMTHYLSKFKMTYSSLSDKIVQDESVEYADNLHYYFQRTQFLGISDLRQEFLSVTNKPKIE